MKIALVGNPNSGKTTLFNLLTGMNAKIGNWPGVTIEKKSGTIKNTTHEIVDLPGIYSLSPYTEEEKVARAFIFNESPDLIINIVDATSLERSLYLTTQLLELGIPVLIALNMADMLPKRGLKIDIQKLSYELKTEVIQISALKATGIQDLIFAIDKTKAPIPYGIYDANIENSIIKIINNLPSNLLYKRFVAVKILEEDKYFSKYNFPILFDIIKETSHNYDTDLEEIVATERYNYIERVREICINKIAQEKTISDKLDEIFLNKWIAFPLFALIMFLIYYLSVGVVGKSTIDLINNITDSLKIFISNWLSNFKISNLIISLIVDGIMTGVGAVLSFVPQLIILFLCISILETSGYMSRTALLLDKLFKKIGLNGKSLIPFIVGSGCSVPGIMSSKIIENDDEKKMTAILTPFIPCSAKLPIIALFTSYFFPNNSGIISASLYFFAIVIIIISALVMKKFVFKNTSSTYISELPEYKLPSLKYVSKDVFDKIISFIKRAGSVILICSIIVWFLVSFSWDLKYNLGIENSILASIGKKISWIFVPMLGTNSWEVTVSAIQGLVAKEQVVSSMAVIGGVSEDLQNTNFILNNNGAFGFFTSVSAYAFMVFNLFSARCFGALAAMRKEIGGTKELLKVISFEISLAWLLATIVYQIGHRIEIGIFNIANFIIVAILIAIIIKICMSKLKHQNSECARCPYCKSCDKN